MKSKNYTYFSERSYTGKDCKIDDKVVDYWKKVLGDNVFNNIEKVYNLRPEIVMSKKDFENVTESKEILQFSELFQTGFGENVKYQLKIGEKGAFVFDRFLDHFIKFGIAVLNEQEIDECIMDRDLRNIGQNSRLLLCPIFFESKRSTNMKQKRVPLIRQVGITDCGFACLTMLFNYYGYNIDISELKAKNSVGRNGLSLAKLKEICQENYFQFKAYKNFSSENDLLMNLPAILFSKTNHYVVVSRKRNNTFELLDPVKGKIQVSFDDIQREYMDILVVIRPRDKFIYSKEKSKFKIPVNRFKLAIVILTTLIAQSIIIIPAIFVQKIVNNLTYAPESFEFRKMILFILGITIALFLSNFIKKRCILILQSDIYKETIQQMIDKIFKIDISFFEGHASGDIQNRFNSVSEIYQFISITLISAIINAVTAIMCALVMMLQSFYLFQILFIIAAAQILIVYFLNKRARIKIKNYIADQSELQGKMVEILTNIQQIRCMRIDTILCKNIKVRMSS